MERIFITNYGRLDKKSKIYPSLEAAASTKCRYIEEFRNGKFYATHALTTTVNGERYDKLDD